MLSMVKLDIVMFGLNRPIEAILSDLAFLYPEVKPVFQQVLHKYNQAIDQLSEKNNVLQYELDTKNCDYNNLNTEIQNIKSEIKCITDECNKLKNNDDNI